LDTTAQKFTIRYTVYSGIDCLDEITQEIIVHKSPEVILAPLEATCEQALPYTLTVGSEQTGISGTGLFSGPGITGGNFFNPAVAGAGVHAIQYKFTTAEGCPATATGEVRVLPTPQLSAGPDRTLVAGGSIRLMATAAGNGLQYNWSPATGLDDAGTLQPLVRTETDRIYRLTATSAEGCSATDDVAVTVVAELYIPNAFTPNGDGLNDTWQVPFLESVSGGAVKVFNRYGQIVFQTAGTLKWDGRFKGAELPSGAYAYLLQYNGKTKKGVVMLLR
jgi:gliding motility-associated-like protein